MLVQPGVTRRCDAAGETRIDRTAKISPMWRWNCANRHDPSDLSKIYYRRLQQHFDPGAVDHPHFIIVLRRIRITLVNRFNYSRGIADRFIVMKLAGMISHLMSLGGRQRRSGF